MNFLMLLGEVLIPYLICVSSEEKRVPIGRLEMSSSRDFNFPLSAEFLYYITIFEYPRLGVVVVE